MRIHFFVVVVLMFIYAFCQGQVSLNIAYIKVKAFILKGVSGPPKEKREKLAGFGFQYKKLPGFGFWDKKWVKGTSQTVERNMFS